MAAPVHKCVFNTVWDYHLFSPPENLYFVSVFSESDTFIAVAVRAKLLWYNKVTLSSYLSCRVLNVGHYAWTNNPASWLVGVGSYGVLKVTWPKPHQGFLLPCLGYSAGTGGWECGIFVSMLCGKRSSSRYCTFHLVEQIFLINYYDISTRPPPKKKVYDASLHFSCYR
jgi:hypothetical protein